MKILVTGAAGFIGSNLAAELLHRGHTVVGFDNLSQGTMLNLAAIEDHAQFSLHRADVREAPAVAEAAAGCDAIVHLAAYKIPRYTDAYDTLMINGLGSEIVAQTAANTGAKIVAASTSDAYGKNPSPPFSEEMDSVIGNPQWVAGENRGAAERARKALEAQRQLQNQRHQVVENQREVNAEARHSHWLSITGQDDYVNPHTGKVEQGSNEYQHRWENSSGDVIYSNNPDYAPRRDRTLQGRTDYKSTPLRPR